LIVVTKTWPATDVRALAALGVHDVGENRDQEAAGKAAACADLELRWHFVGQLQTNKARSVAGYAGWVHSVDRLRLVEALSTAALRHGRTVTCLVQVDLDPAERAAAAGEAPRGGVRPAEVAALADAVEQAPSLRLGGVMAVAPQHADAVEAFGRLAEVAGRLRAEHPHASAMSAGMSGDLEAAVAAGATHLRVGTAVLGSRPPLG
jgi:pyridoxal phosphate enzyme (YggS family)